MSSFQAAQFRDYFKLKRRPTKDVAWGCAATALSQSDKPSAKSMIPSFTLIHHESLDNPVHQNAYLGIKISSTLWFRINVSTMAFQEEVPSVKTPALQDIQPVPVVGTKAPRSSQIPIPNPNGKPTIITFLRKCGCPCKSVHRSPFLTSPHKHPKHSRGENLPSLSISSESSPRSKLHRRLTF